MVREEVEMLVKVSKAASVHRLYIAPRYEDIRPGDKVLVETSSGGEVEGIVEEVLDSYMATAKDLLEFLEKFLGYRLLRVTAKARFERLDYKLEEEWGYIDKREETQADKGMEEFYSEKLKEGAKEIIAAYDPLRDPFARELIKHNGE